MTHLHEKLIVLRQLTGELGPLRVPQWMLDHVC